MAMKSDKLVLLRAMADIPHEHHVYVRDLVRRLGINEKRACYILNKWIGKGWYNCGVGILAGWLEPKGREESQKLR